MTDSLAIVSGWAGSNTPSWRPTPYPESAETRAFWGYFPETKEMPVSLNSMSAARHRLPAVYPLRNLPQPVGLLPIVPISLTSTGARRAVCRAA
jgi:hypothetical protein